MDGDEIGRLSGSGGLLLVVRERGHGEVERKKKKKSFF